MRTESAYLKHNLIYLQAWLNNGVPKGLKIGTVIKLDKEWGGQQGWANTSIIQDIWHKDDFLNQCEPHLVDKFYMMYDDRVLNPYILQVFNKIDNRTHYLIQDEALFWHWQSIEYPMISYMFEPNDAL